MGSKITKLQPVGGFAAETGAAVAIFIATHFGVGVSSTHTITGAIVGVGATRRLSAVRWGVAGQIVWAWVLTIPAAAFIGAVRVTSSLSLGRLQISRQIHREDAPCGSAFAAVTRAAVQADEVAHDRQAQAGAAGIAAVARARLVDAIEALEHPRRDRSGGMPGPCVLDANQHAVAAPARARS